VSLTYSNSSWSLECNGCKAPGGSSRIKTHLLADAGLRGWKNSWCPRCRAALKGFWVIKGPEGYLAIKNRCTPLWLETMEDATRFLNEELALKIAKRCGEAYEVIKFKSKSESNCPQHPLPANETQGTGEHYKLPRPYLGRYVF